jgi:hypothetical protein
MVEWVRETQSSEREEGRVLANGLLETGKVRYSIRGKNPTIFTLEARYPNKGKGKAWQQQEAAGLAFFLANLKSRSVKGPDPRSKNSKYSRQKGFID